jgi:hypothetical protein
MLTAMVLRLNDSGSGSGSGRGKNIGFVSIEGELARRLVVKAAAHRALG